MVNVSRAADGSKTGGWSSAPISPMTCLSGVLSSKARCVGTMPRCARTNNGSPKFSRNRVSMPLIAGCVTPKRVAARVTLHSSSSASKALSRLKSNALISFILIQAKRQCCFPYIFISPIIPRMEFENWMTWCIRLLWVGLRIGTAATPEGGSKRFVTTFTTGAADRLEAAEPSFQQVRPKVVRHSLNSEFLFV